MVIMLVLPVSVHAGMLSAFTEKVKAVFLRSPENISSEASATSQTMAVFKPVVVGQDNTMDIIDTSSSSAALSATTGSLRVSTEDIVFPTNDTISVYEIKNGDTLATIAKLFGVSKNTIIWANDLKGEKLIPGQSIIILPITGVRHTVRSGDTLATIAKKYKGDMNDIAKYNGITEDSALTAGDVVIVPEGEIAVSVTPSSKGSKKSFSGSVSTYERLLETYSYSTPSGFLIRPISGGRKTQGLHGHNGVDIGASVGTPVYASADGTVIAARSSGYNGGYGSMIIISHDGNVQTVYGHLSAVDVTAGQHISQGDMIGAVGNSGKSTGPHLHFEVRGAKNPF